MHFIRKLKNTWEDIFCLSLILIIILSYIKPFIYNKDFLWIDEAMTFVLSFFHSDYLQLSKINDCLGLYRTVYDFSSLSESISRITNVLYKANETHPPLYYILISLWGSFLEITKESLRLFSFLGFILTAYLGYIYSQTSYSLSRNRFILTLLIITVPIYVYQSSSIRMHSWTPAFFLFSLISMNYIKQYQLISNKRKELKWNIYFFISILLGMYWSYTFIFASIAFLPFIYNLFTRDKKRTYILLSLITLLYLTWFLPFGLEQALKEDFNEFKMLMNAGEYIFYNVLRIFDLYSINLSRNAHFLNEYSFLISGFIIAFFILKHKKNLLFSILLLTIVIPPFYDLIFSKNYFIWGYGRSINYILIPFSIFIARFYNSNFIIKILVLGMILLNFNKSIDSLLTVKQSKYNTYTKGKTLIIIDNRDREAMISSLINMCSDDTTYRVLMHKDREIKDLNKYDSILLIESIYRNHLKDKKSFLSQKSDYTVIEKKTTGAYDSSKYRVTTYNKKID